MPHHTVRFTERIPRYDRMSQITALTDFLNIDYTHNDFVDRMCFPSSIIKHWENFKIFYFKRNDMTAIVIVYKLFISARLKKSAEKGSLSEC